MKKMRNKIKTLIISLFSLLLFIAPINNSIVINAAERIPAYSSAISALGEVVTYYDYDLYPMALLTTEVSLYIDSSKYQNLAYLDLNLEYDTSALTYEGCDVLTTTLDPSIVNNYSSTSEGAVQTIKTKKDADGNYAVSNDNGYVGKIKLKFSVNDSSRLYPYETSYIVLSTSGNNAAVVNFEGEVISQNDTTLTTSYTSAGFTIEGGYVPADATVSFNNMGIGTAIDNCYLIPGSLVPAPFVAEVEGYRFDGWYEDSNFKYLWDFTSYTVYTDMTLYAKWTKLTNEYTVSYNMMGLGNSISKETVEENALATKPTDPTADGYTFDGWYLDENYTDSWDFSTPITKDIVLYAKWNKVINNYIVSFDLLGHGNNITSLNVQEGDTITAPTNPKADGYEFKGWYLDKSCTKKMNFATTITSNLVIYAKWAKIETIPVVHVHDYQLTKEVLPGCEEEGYRIYSCVCGDSYQVTIPALGHLEYVEISRVDPTCETNGEIVYECPRCHQTKTEVLPALGHNYGEWVTIKEATAFQKGIRRKTCINNPEEYIEEKTSTSTTAVVATAALSTTSIASIGIYGYFILHMLKQLRWVRGKKKAIMAEKMGRKIE